jgi:hypothetical protein
MNYFRAVLRTGEQSERVMDLIADVLKLNPANYTAWCALLPCRDDGDRAACSRE